MGASEQGIRSLKKKVLEWLKAPDFESTASELGRLPPQQAINVLLPCLYHGEERIKWRAVTLLGGSVALLADQNMEEARNVIRRLMWNLNDESGGIGWGSPEAMGETLARHRALAREYVHILVSYTRQDANYLESEVLQRGLLWALARVFRSWPELRKHASPCVLPYLTSQDAAVRALAAELLGVFGEEAARTELHRLLVDDAEYEEPMERSPARRRVADAAAEALAKLTA